MFSHITQLTTNRADLWGGRLCPSCTCSARPQNDTPISCIKVCKPCTFAQLRHNCLCAVYQLWAWNNLGLGIEVNHIIMNAEQTELMVNSLEHVR